MTARKSTFTLLLTITAALLIIPGCCGERENVAGHSRPSGDGTSLSREAPVRTRLPRPYGKLKVPAELFVDLIQPERARNRRRTGPKRGAVGRDSFGFHCRGTGIRRAPPAGGQVPFRSYSRIHA